MPKFKNTHTGEVVHVSEATGKTLEKHWKPLREAAKDTKSSGKSDSSS